MAASTIFLCQHSAVNFRLIAIEGNSPELTANIAVGYHDVMFSRIIHAHDRNIYYDY